MTDSRHELVRAGARSTELGLSPGSSGNLSVREGSSMVMTPTGVPLGGLDAQELSVLDLATGRVLDGPPPSKEFPLHRALYARSGDIGAVVHLHSAYAAAWSCTHHHDKTAAVPPITPYFVMKVGRTPLIDYAPPGDPHQACKLLLLLGLHPVRHLTGDEATHLAEKYGAPWERPHALPRVQGPRQN